MVTYLADTTPGLLSEGEIIVNAPLRSYKDVPRFPDFNTTMLEKDTYH